MPFRSKTKVILTPWTLISKPAKSPISTAIKNDQKGRAHTSLESPSGSMAQGRYDPPRSPHLNTSQTKNLSQILSRVLFREAPCYRHIIRVPIDMWAGQMQLTSPKLMIEQLDVKLQKSKPRHNSNASRGRVLSHRQGKSSARIGCSSPNSNRSREQGSKS